MDPVFNPDAIEQWARSVGIFGLMNSQWGWPAAEIVHFFGLCLLIATVGMFDLRMMGVARGVSMKALHKLVPFGIAGYAMCAITGFMFVVSAPSQYLYNPAIQTKLSLMAIAGVNVVVFYLTTSRAVSALGDYDLPPSRARVIGFISLACWLGVITAGRLVTFFRPPEFWCLWCVVG
ncbi:MAG: hypothetical protein B7Y90_06310 [Alphaproteobacteria bacterium 32-64-14]|nr:MAG: hypothetical protein B7Y90_06310 [Alphaproteobacteria bacterium 32-64-14]